MTLRTWRKVLFQNFIFTALKTHFIAQILPASPQHWYLRPIYSQFHSISAIINVFDFCETVWKISMAIRESLCIHVLHLDWTLMVSYCRIAYRITSLTTNGGDYSNKWPNYRFAEEIAEIWHVNSTKNYRISQTIQSQSISYCISESYVLVYGMTFVYLSTIARI